MIALPSRRKTPSYRFVGQTLTRKDIQPAMTQRYFTCYFSRTLEIDSFHKSYSKKLSQSSPLQIECFEKLCAEVALRRCS